MDTNVDVQLLFRVDEVMEAKSFDIGFRSAWFRCKIKNYQIRRGQQWCALEYFDYPDEEITWTKLYQKLPQQHNRANANGNLELMVRPSFPPIFKESQLPVIFPASSDVIAIVSDTWKIGDLVDWWFQNCYWSGKISKILEDDKVSLDLPDPPIGEGKSYDADCKDLRPTLDWTPESGWKVPAPEEHESLCSCARLIHRDSQEAIKMRADALCHGFLEDIEDCSSSTSNESSEGMITPTKALPSTEAYATADMEDGHMTKNDQAISAKIGTEVQNMLNDHFNYLEGIWINEMRRTASLRCPTVESSIIRLEMLSQKIRWLKGLVKLDPEFSSPVKHTWEFVESQRAAPH
ncbi:uncharacterized protein LOC122040968 isoform X1 [Zingiber officinale]|uniref:uncharacterized protein LOC122040968 isoform X1 n=1 Tax=Zingiber officinale TaxID=94328 RepID=UPI001C4C27F4|nr:uncharacterized protein LOC122040968 isoform X1 [Zingiber officinale]XP_042456400.1 uncharacterized protein LOC122040968 isoform X1 [Zingiber officinale]